ncbi:MAG: GNAT family N-acetyltransferase [Rhodobacter sp.]|nr:GNAT family N-acetyltransferase [Rhodobacter sp.]
MAGLLNDIIRIGGTTAHTDPVDAKTLLKWMAAWPGRSNWHVAVAEDGALMGFQFAEPHPLLSADTADVATFVRVGATGRGIGSQLFAATRSATLALGYAAMVAVIRADNTGGLAYYRGRGFREIDRLRGVTLGNGLVVDKIVARFDLR